MDLRSLSVLAKVSIFQKMRHNCLTRVRKTNKSLDAFVEMHRRLIARNPKDKVKFDIRLESADSHGSEITASFFVTMHKSNDSTTALKDPYKQLSAVAFTEIDMTNCLSGEMFFVNQLEYHLQDLVFSVLDKMRPVCHLASNRNFPTEAVLRAATLINCNQFAVSRFEDQEHLDVGILIGNSKIQKFPSLVLHNFWLEQEVCSQEILQKFMLFSKIFLFHVNPLFISSVIETLFLMSDVQKLHSVTFFTPRDVVYKPQIPSAALFFEDDTIPDRYFAVTLVQQPARFIVLLNRKVPTRNSLTVMFIEKSERLVFETLIRQIEQFIDGSDRRQFFLDAARKVLEHEGEESDSSHRDRIAPSSVKIHREPIRDSRRTISAARISSSRPNAPSRSGGIRAPPSIAGRLSRPGQSSSSSASRRPESYSGPRPETDEVQRMREELRLREAGLEREREKLRIEREKIDREKLELQVLQQQQQLAALKANLEGTRSGRGDSRGHGQSSSSSRDKYAATSSRAAPEPRRSHEKVATRPSRPDDRRGHISQGDRSRSRHDSRSHHGEGRSRHESHSRHEPRHEPRHDSRHEPSRHVPATYGGSRRNNSSYSSREAPPLIPGQNQYGSRDSYASGLSSRDFDASRGTTSGSSWGQASWAGLPTAGDGWGVRGGGNAAGGEWSSSAYGSGGGGAGSSASNIRIDYDKYRRQY